METSNPKIINETITFWKKKAGVTFSSEEARQAVENICGFFEILQEWADAEDCNEDHNEIAHENLVETKGLVYDHSL